MSYAYCYHAYRSNRRTVNRSACVPGLPDVPGYMAGILLAAYGSGGAEAVAAGRTTMGSTRQSWIPVRSTTAVLPRSTSRGDRPAHGDLDEDEESTRLQNRKKVRNWFFVIDRVRYAHRKKINEKKGNINEIVRSSLLLSVLFMLTFYGGKRKVEASKAGKGKNC